MQTLTPSCAKDVSEAIADALAGGETLAITGGASKAAIGAPVAARTLAMTGLRGVIDYDPAELVLTVRAGTRLEDVQSLVAGAGQRLAFDPFDHGAIFGRPARDATIGGIVAAGVSGSGRLSGGAARDHLLGFQAVSGRGEIFSAGAKVVKNVTGFDLSKLATGSWGRLFAITELTLKVLPRPREVVTRMLVGLDERRAVGAMSRAMGSQAEVAAAAYFPKGLAGDRSRTILRVEGFEHSVPARCGALAEALAGFGPLVAPAAAEAEGLWESLRTLAPLGAGRPLWRVSIAPSRAHDMIASLERDAAYLLDWAGGLIWIASDADPVALRQAAAGLGGHAMLVRAEAGRRAATPCLHPPAPGLASLEARVRRAFDPGGVFETGRF